MARLSLFAWTISGNRPRLKNHFRRLHYTSAARCQVLRLRLELPLGKDKFKGSPPLRMTKFFGFCPIRSDGYDRRGCSVQAPTLPQDRAFRCGETRRSMCIPPQHARSGNEACFGNPLLTTNQEQPMQPPTHP